MNETIEQLGMQQESVPNTAPRIIGHRRNKPKHWSLKSNAPYYRESFALGVKKVLDRMIETMRDQIYYYKDFPENTPNSIYLKFQQARKYLLDHLDPDGKYADFNQAISVRKMTGVGVKISIRQDVLQSIVSGGADFMPKEMTTDKLAWKEKMFDYIQNGEVGIPFLATNLTLDEDEQHALEVQLAGLGDSIVYRITEREVKVVKV